MIKSNLEELVKQTGVASDRINYLFQDQVELRTNVKKCKKDYKQMKKDFEIFKQKLLVIEQHNGIYFDAYR